MNAMPSGPPLVGIIADDLTSAADGAGPVVRRGLAASLLSGDTAESAPCQALSIDTDSRAMPPEGAVAATEAAARRLSGCRWLYEAVDSTLRGHVRDEIVAAVRGSGRRQVLFAPAFPEAGRISPGRVQYVGGFGDPGSLVRAVARLTGRTVDA